MKRLIHISLALLLLFTTTGISMSKHYCMGRLVSMAYFEDADTCGGAEEDSMPCCEDVDELLKVEELTSADFDFEINPHLFLFYSVEFSDEEVTDNFFTGIHAKIKALPPPEDAIVLFQNFRI